MIKTQHEIAKFYYDAIMFIAILWLVISRFMLGIASKTKFLLALVKVQKIIWLWLWHSMRINQTI